MNTFDARSNSTLMRAAVLVAIAIVAATAVWLGTRGQQNSDNDPSAGASQGSTTSTDSTGANGGSERVAPASATDAPTDGVTLPSGSDQVNGYPVKFPYSDLGAVALQASVAKAQLGFDYDQASEVATLYADPDDAEVFADRSRDAVALRRQQAGVPESGDPQPPASYAVTPIAYTLEELGPDYFAVNLLSYITLTTTQGEVKDGLYAGTQLIRWIDEDWKLVEGSEDDIRHLLEEGQPKAVAPGTGKFEKAGWIRLSGEPQ